MKEEENLDVLLPAVNVKCGTMTFQVQPFPFAKLPEVLAIVKSIGASVYEMMEKQKEGRVMNAEGKVVGSVKNEFSDAIAAKIADIVALHFDEVAKLMAIYCRVDKSIFLDEKNGFSVEDGIILALTILAVHKRFFIQRVAPLLKKVKQE